MLNKTLFSVKALAAAALFALPMSAGAVTVSGDVADGGMTNISIGDVFQMEIDGDASDGAGDASFGFTASEELVTIETNSFNPTTGFTGAVVKWTENSDGTGAVYGTITGAALLAGDALEVYFGAGETKWLFASWTNVVSNGSNFDLRVEAANVPLPAGVVLMGTALAGFGIARRRRKS